MRVLPIILIIFSVFFDLKAQSKSTKSIANSPIVGQNEDNFGAEVDSLTEMFQDFQRTHHYGPFVDFVPEVEDSVIIKRIASVESDIPLRFDNKIKGFIDYFAVRNRDYTRKMIKRSQVYFPIIEEILAKNNMPQSLKYLAIVESGLDPTIKSWAGALGLWQFMPATGKSYSLDYDAYIDERQNPYKSTEAACKYLKMLYNMFGDWELALGAYNCGPGNMRKAIRSSGNQKTFSDIYNYLPKETRSYVPQFMAVNYVMRFAQEHNLYVEEWEGDYLPESDTILVNQYLDLNKLCSLTGVCSEHFIELNPEIKRNAVTEVWQNYPLIIPKELSLLGKDSLRSLFILAAIKDTTVTEKIEQASKPTTDIRTEVVNNKIKHKVKSGQSLGSLASKYGVSVTNIKKWNGIKGSTIYPGQIITIYKKSTVTKTTTTSSTVIKQDESSKPDEKPTTFEENGKTYYIVKSGDILSTVAAKNDVTMTQIKTWNKLSSSAIKVGQKLIVNQVETSEDNTEESNNQTTSVEPVKKQTYKTYYTVKSGDALGLIASKNGLTLTQIKSMNGLRSNTIHAGQKLVVKVSEKPIKEVVETAPEKPKTIVEGANTIYVVKSGDILGTIASKNNVTLDQIKAWNNLSSNNINVGQRLIVAKSPSSKTVEVEKEITVDKKTVTPVSSNTETYTVKSGESLYIIATKFNMTIAALKTLNNLKTDKVSVGQKLLVTSKQETKTTTATKQTQTPKSYTVQSGDTLWSITQKFNVSVDQLKKLNNLKSSELKVGQVLQLAQN